MRLLSIKELYRDGFEGYTIETDKSSISIGIHDYAYCCESFGSITSHEDFEYFKGSKILKIEKVEEKYGDWEKSEILIKEIDYADQVDCAFINIETDKGPIQFAVYNNHNGCYGHTIFIEEKLKDLE